MAKREIKRFIRSKTERKNPIVILDRKSLFKKKDTKKKNSSINFSLQMPLHHSKLWNVNTYSVYKINYRYVTKFKKIYYDISQLIFSIGVKYSVCLRALNNT